MAPAPKNITAYDVRLSVRYSGEDTAAEGWIELDGTRHAFRVEASASDRGATYILDGESHWWNEVEWLDDWFEDLWMRAAADAGYDFDNDIDFDARMTSGDDDQEEA